MTEENSRLVKGWDDGAHGCDGCCHKGAIDIEAVFTVKSAPSAGQPDGGHVITYRAQDLPKVGQYLVQSANRWPILGVEQFRSECFRSSGHADHAHNIGVLVPKDGPKPAKGAARIEGEAHE